MRRFSELVKRSPVKKVTPRQAAKLAGAAALSKKAQDVLVLDLKGISTVADFFVICSGNSDVQVKAIADAIVEGLKGKGMIAWHTEGYGARRWVLIDFVDVVAHVFHKDAREYYKLESLWSDAKRIGVD